MAIAAIIPIIATTMRSSINEKPSWRLVVMLIWCSLKKFRGFKFSRHQLTFVCEPRKAQSVGGLLNNLYAKSGSDQNEEKSIFFDRNFDWRSSGRRGSDNFCQEGDATKRHQPQTCK